MTAGVIEAVYREERGRILASLIRLARDFDDAEDALAEAFVEAQKHWPGEGLPRNAGAWILTVAKRRLIDLRRVSARRRQLLAANATPAMLTDSSDEDELPDDVLRLIFTCCHPALSPEAQIALTLRTLGGLETAEIARAFLVDETAMAQRIVRAKKKIATAGVRYSIPTRAEVPERLESVLRVLYLIFNEGYSATSGEALQRRELCAEAIRLARLLNEWMPSEAEAEGLLALLLLTHSRRDARTDALGQLVTLDQQDRGLWRRGEIEEGRGLVRKALARKSLGPYQVQAAIMALHAEAARAEDTDWRQIQLLYEELMRFDESAIVRLNHAVALGYASGWENASCLLETLTALNDYYPFHAARAQCYLALGKRAEARAAFQHALQLTNNGAERQYLSSRMDFLEKQTAVVGEGPVW